jgi:hypothetical protein
MPDGRLQVTPVWVDYDGEHVMFNSAKGRQKDRMCGGILASRWPSRDSGESVPVPEIRGKVVEITEQGATLTSDKLAKKYSSVDKYPYAQASEVRVIYKIKPEHTIMG